MTEKENSEYCFVHPTLWISEAKSRLLHGKTIVLGVTGSIAAVQTVTLARELIRHGADVYAVTTDAALSIIHENALCYATGHPVMTKITGNVEHVAFFGSRGIADLFLIAPSTANTISKIAMGIDDTPVTTFATTAIGEGKKVMIVPAMHDSMYRHPQVLKNLETLESWGIEVVGPRVEEGIAKIAGGDEIVLRVCRMLGNQSLLGRSVFITSGATAESIDPIRLLTNRASGKTGTALAKEAYVRGAEVYLFHRNVSPFARLPHFHDIYTESAGDMTDAVLDKISFADVSAAGKNILISAAAISDYTAERRDSKIKSGSSSLSLTLRPTKKLIEEARYTDSALFITAYKAETGLSHDSLIESAASKIEDKIADMIVANDVSKKGMGTTENDVYVVTKEYLKHRDPAAVISLSGSKEEIAAELFDLICLESDGEDTAEYDGLKKEAAVKKTDTVKKTDAVMKTDAVKKTDTVKKTDAVVKKEAFAVFGSPVFGIQKQAGPADNSDAGLNEKPAAPSKNTKNGIYRKPAQMKGNVFKKRK